MSTQLSFEAKDKKIKDILFGNLNYSLKVPRYQRPYAWTENEISDFWNDLNNQDQEYFLGSFILNRQFENEGYLEVIDGQQRLLTITMLISVLRNYAKTLADEKIAGILQRQCIAFEDEDGNETFRVIPGESTNNFFKKYVQESHHDINVSDPKTKEEALIKKNYIDLYGKVHSYIDQFDSNEKKLEKLKELRKKAGELIAIDIKIKSEDVAYEIFETVNARGVELSVSDLLKNLVFSKIKENEGKDIAKEMWAEINDNIAQTGTDLKKFIRYYWISKYHFVSEKRLYSSIKKHITDWPKFIDDLYDASNWYNAILEGNIDDFKQLKNAEKIYRSIFATRLMNVSQCHVLFLGVLQNINYIKSDPTKIFQLIEKFTYQYSAVCKLPGNRVEKIYSKTSRDLYKVIRDSVEDKNRIKKVQTVFNNLREELKDIIPSRELFIENFKTLSYGRSDKSRQLIKYTLEELNMVNTTGEHKLDFDKVNIEHILPQDPKKWGLSKQDVKSYVNLIGNLTLLSRKINSSVGNDIIPKKLLELEKSEIKITKDLVEFLKKDETWNQFKILERQEAFAEVAFDEIWKIN